MKLQTVFDLKNDCYENVEMSGFNRNDQAASADLLCSLQPGDLVVRDLGYFVLSVFTQIACTGAYFLTRLQSGTCVLDPTTHEHIDLLKLLRKAGNIDVDVLAGAQEKLPTRLIARRVPPEIAAERRRKARGNRDKRAKNAKEKLALLDWEIFLTNVPRHIWTADTATQVYGFRWRIEILFKAWKSFLQFTELPHNVSKTEVRCLTFARVYNAMQFHCKVWQPVRYTLQAHGKYASLLKTVSIFTGPNGERLLQMRQTNPEAFEATVLQHCCYDQRRRVPYEAIFDQYTDGNFCDELPLLGEALSFAHSGFAH